MATGFVHRGPCGLMSGCGRQGRQSLLASSSWLSGSLSRSSYDRLQQSVPFNAGRKSPRSLNRSMSSGRDGRRGLFVCAGWGAEMEWSKGTIMETSKAAEGLVRCIVDIGDLAGGYTIGGQYVQLKVGDSKPGFFAIASAPSAQSSIELLVKNQGATAEILCDSKAGDQVDVSPVMGKGFPIQRVPPEKVPNLYIFATGTGISPIKALIESGELQAEKRKMVRLYYGTFHPDSTAYAKLAPQWEEKGIEIVNVYSGLGHGYVQDVFKRDNGISDGQHTAVILCGQREMAEAVTAIVEAVGVPKDFILTNF